MNMDTYELKQYLLKSVNFGDLTGVQIALENGASPYSRRYSDFRSILEIAEREGFDDIASLISITQSQSYKTEPQSRKTKFQSLKTKETTVEELVNQYRASQSTNIEEEDNEEHWSCEDVGMSRIPYTLAS